MITFTVRMDFAADDRDEITRTLVELTRETRREPGCVSYIAHWVEGRPECVLIYEQYKDEAGVEAHRASPHFAKYAVGVLYQKMKERQVENLNAIS